MSGRRGLLATSPSARWCARPAAALVYSPRFVVAPTGFPIQLGRRPPGDLGRRRQQRDLGLVFGEW
ncbi:MAG: hypothetical protein R3F43_04265 [bacterium]